MNENPHTPPLRGSLPPEGADPSWGGPATARTVVKRTKDELARRVAQDILDGAYFHHADSFAMMRGGHLDICMLGAFQISATGDLANWSTGEPGSIPTVGGAMDLAIGAKQTWVMMDLLTKSGASKVVDRCTYPLTGIGCVRRIYTDLATLACSPDGLQLIDMVEGMTLAQLQDIVGLEIREPPEPGWPLGHRRTGHA